MKLTTLILALVLVAGCSLEQLNRTERHLQATTRATTHPLAEVGAAVVPYGDVAKVSIGAAAGLALAVVAEVRRRKALAK